MARDPKKLKDRLLKVADELRRSPVDVASGYADAYAAYAADARSLIGNAPSGPAIEAARAKLAQMLVPAFSMVPPTQAADLIALALTAFWMVPPMVFSGSFPGVATAAPGAALLPKAILLAWSTNMATLSRRPEATARIAQVFHAFTSTVVCTDATVPSPTVGPIL